VLRTNALKMIRLVAIHSRTEVDVCTGAFEFAYSSYATSVLLVSSSLTASIKSISPLGFKQISRKGTRRNGSSRRHKLYSKEDQPCSSRID